MLTLLEFCERFKISQRKARLMMKAGALMVSDLPDKQAVKIVETLAQHNPLAASSLCALLEAPGLALQLGRYSERALDQLSDVGDAKGEQAPREVALAVADAARGDPDAVSIVCDWIKRALPADGSPVSHSWLACRLLLPLPANIREFENSKIVRALSYARKTDALAGWFEYAKRGSRKAAIYSRPICLAELDL